LRSEVGDVNERRGWTSDAIISQSVGINSCGNEKADSQAVSLAAYSLWNSERA